jgi:hypothetical protein
MGLTDAGWQSSRDPSRLLAHLFGRLKPQPGRVVPYHPERFRLFAVACCRRLWPLLGDGDRQAIELLERYSREDARELFLTARKLHKAEGIVAGREMTAASGKDYVIQMRAWAKSLASSAVWRVTTEKPARTTMAWSDAARAVGSLEAADGYRAGRPEPQTNWNLSSEAERAVQAELIRDIFGNPFRPIAFDPSWRTSAALALANSMYESRDFAAMPVLADALEEAGCGDADILSHCRGGGPHVRGCWVVDLVLGKQ